MLGNLRVIARGDRAFPAFVFFVAVSAVVQAAAVLTLYPLLQDLFGPDPVSAWPWVVALCALILAAWGLDIAAAHRGLDLGIRVLRTIEGNAPHAVSSWPRAALTDTKVGRMRKLVSSGANEATSAVVLMVGPIITSFVFTFALGVGLLLIDVAVAVVTIVGGLLLIVALRVSLRLESRAEHEFGRANEELDSRLFEFAQAQPSLRTSRHTSAGRRIVDDAIAGARRRGFKLLWWEVPGTVLFALVLQVVLIAFGVATWLAFDTGAVSSAGAAALVIVLLRVVEQVGVVSDSVVGILGISRTLAETRELMETTPIVRPAPSPTAPAIHTEQLGLTYPDGTVGTADVSESFSPGSVTVVVGHSGSGKTTLLRALAGLVDTRGRILLDGEPAGLGTLRSNAAVVFQRTALGSGTVRDSITAVDPQLTDTDLERLAEDSGLRRALDGLPHGWDTSVGELGQWLSGGERQRVGIARALAKPARVLLIDEATSALDSRNERAVIEAISTIRGAYTTVIVTHRPATLDIADRVIVMDRGRVVESGTPTELEASGGEYARLVEQWRASAAWRVG